MRTRSCPVCAARTSGSALQVYLIKGALGTWAFNIKKASAIVADHRKPVLVPPEILARLLEVNKEWHEEHLPHVNSKEPGIIGQRFGGIALFDGTHRAVNAQRSGDHFYAYMLTVAESQECIVHNEVPAMTADLIASELRGVLKNNRNVKMLEAEVVLDPTDNALDCEHDIRSFLTAGENRHLRLIFSATRKQKGKHK